jgi:putative transposase
MEYAGAFYHVISRGNYRKELFVEKGSGKRFEETLMETVSRCGWRLLGYVIMSNHYHLALETPEPNLVEGMKWLQGTFATRFNRYRKENGHVFQGRYKALLVGEGRSRLGLIDYIHLNPVRAGICDMAQLRNYSLSSYAQYWKRKVVDGLDREGMLSLLGLPNNLSGMRGYEEYLYAREGEGTKEGSADYQRGWFIGSCDEKKRLLKDLSSGEVDRELSRYAELKRDVWESLVQEELQRLGKTEEDVRCSLKGASWKIEIATRLRKTTTASNPWIAQRLCMGHPTRISYAIRTGYRCSL